MDKSSEMSTRQSIAVVAGPFEGNRKSWFARVPRKVPAVTFRTVRALWYGEIDDPNHWAAREIKRAADVIEARNKARARADLYRIIMGEARAKDKDSYRAGIARLEHLARILGDKDSS